MTQRALITGITGQDGSYLAELLLREGYRVFGLARRGSASLSDRLRHVQGEIQIVEGSLLDQASLAKALRRVRPAEVYNLASQSFVPASWDNAVESGDVTGLGVVRLLEAVREVDPAIRLYQASSSEMFGLASSSPQDEQTPFRPWSPYGVAKLYGHFMIVNYRQRHGLFAVSGIAYNHESPRRGLEFVTRKVADGAARIRLGLARELRLGNLDAERDWGFAGDFVRAMWLMLQCDTPSDYVLATGESHTVRELCEIAFSHVGLEFRDHVVVDPTLVRPLERVRLVGDPSRAEHDLGWRPKVKFEEIIRMMVDADLERLHKTSGASANHISLPSQIRVHTSASPKP